MLETIIEIVAIIAILYHATCVLLNRRELKRLNALITQEHPTYVEKKAPNKPPRRAARLSDASKKWLETKGKRDKEVN